MKFKAKIWKTGGSHVITVPYAFIEADMLTVGKEYQLNINEVNNDEQENGDSD